MTGSASTATVAAVQHQRRRLRYVRRWLVVALVCVAMLGLLGLTAVRRDAASLLQPEDNGVQGQMGCQSALPLRG